MSPVGNVLVYCPCYPTFPRVYGRAMKSIMALEHEGPLPVVFEQSASDAIEGFDDITDKYNEARHMTLVGGYDALFCVEADMIVPPDALLKLSALDTDVARGLYVSRHEDRCWYAFTSMHNDRAMAVAESLEMQPDRAIAALAGGEVIDTVGGALGCTLIHRRVLERVSFRYEGAAPCDWWFSSDVHRAGFRQSSHCGVVCGHILPGGKSVLWPDTESPDLYREESC